MSGTQVRLFVHEILQAMPEEDRSEVVAAAKPYEVVPNHHIVVMLFIRAFEQGKLRQAASELAGHERITTELSEQIARKIGLPEV